MADSDIPKQNEPIAKTPLGRTKVKPVPTDDVGSEENLRDEPMTQEEVDRLQELQTSIGVQCDIEHIEGSLELGDVLRKSFRIYSHGGSVDVGQLPEPMPSFQPQPRWRGQQQQQQQYHYDNDPDEYEESKSENTRFPYRDYQNDAYDEEAESTASRQQFRREFIEAVNDLKERVKEEGITVPVDKNGVPILTPEFLETLPEDLRQKLTKPPKQTSGRRKKEKSPTAERSQMNLASKSWTYPPSEVQNGEQMLNGRGRDEFGGLQMEVGADGVPQGMMMGPDGIPLVATTHGWVPAAIIGGPGAEQQWAPDGSQIGANGMPLEHNGMHMGPHSMQIEPHSMQLGQNGIQMGPNNMPIGQTGMPLGQIGMQMGPHSTQMEPNGMHLEQNGMLMGPNGMQVGQTDIQKGPNSMTEGPNGMPGVNGMLIGPNGMQMGQTNMPGGQNGMQMGPNDMPVGQNGMQMGPDGVPMLLNVMPMGPNGLQMGSDGIPMLPKGVYMGPNGILLLPNGMPMGSGGFQIGPDGIAMLPNGVQIGPNGQLIEKGGQGGEFGKPGEGNGQMGIMDMNMNRNGVLILSNGLQIGPNGQLIESGSGGTEAGGPGMGTQDMNMEQNKWQMGSNGIQMMPNGMQMMPNGMLMMPNGMQMMPNGMLMMPNGMQIMPNGMQIMPNGMQMMPNGMQMMPNGTMLGPNGTIVGPNDMMIGPNGLPIQTRGLGEPGTLEQTGGHSISTSQGEQQTGSNRVLIGPNGMQMLPNNGMAMGFNGFQMGPDGTQRGPEGSSGGSPFQNLTAGNKVSTGIGLDPYSLIRASPGTFTAPDGTRMTKLADGRIVYFNSSREVDYQELVKLYGQCPHGMIKGMYCAACTAAGLQPDFHYDPMLQEEAAGLNESVKQAVGKLEKGGWKLLDSTKRPGAKGWTVNALPLKTSEDVDLYNYYLLCLEGKFQYPNKLKPAQLLNLIMLLITDTAVDNYDDEDPDTKESRETQRGIFQKGKASPRFHNFPACYIKDGTCGRAPRKFSPDELKFLVDAVDYIKSNAGVAMKGLSLLKKTKYTENVEEKTEDSTEEDEEKAKEEDPNKMEEIWENLIQSGFTEKPDVETSASDYDIQSTLKDLNRFNLPAIKSQEWDIKKSLDGTHPVTREEVAIHSEFGDILVIRNHVVLNLLSVVLNNINEHREKIQPILKMKGSDISHWFDPMTGDPRTKIDIKTGKKVLYSPDGFYYGLGPVKQFLESEEQGDNLLNSSSSVKSVTAHKNALGDADIFEVDAQDDYLSYKTENFEDDIVSGFSVVVREPINFSIVDEKKRASDGKPKELEEPEETEFDEELSVQDIEGDIYGEEEEEVPEQDNVDKHNSELVFIKERSNTSSRSSASSSSSTGQLKALGSGKESPINQSPHDSGGSSPIDEYLKKSYETISPTIVSPNKSNENSPELSSSPKKYSSISNIYSGEIEGLFETATEYQYGDNKQSEFRGESENEFDLEDNLETEIENYPASSEEPNFTSMAFKDRASSINTIDVPPSVLFNTSNVALQGSSCSRLSNVSSSFSRNLSFDTNVATTVIDQSLASVEPGSHKVSVAYEEPWWMEPKYIAGFVPLHTFEIRIVNSLSYDEKTLVVSKEYTVNDVMRSYLPFNANAMSYTWKDIFGNVLHPNKTLVENGLINEDNADEADFNRNPTIILYFQNYGLEDETSLKPQELLDVEKNNRLPRNY